MVLQYIMKMYDVFETKQHRFLVLEYLAGGELYDALLKNGKCATEQAFKYFFQVRMAWGCVLGLFSRPPRAVWNAPHKAAPACALGGHGRGHPADVCRGGAFPHSSQVHVLFTIL